MNPEYNYRQAADFICRIAGYTTVASKNYTTATLSDQVRDLETAINVLNATIYEARRLAGHNGLIKPIQADTATKK